MSTKPSSNAFQIAIDPNLMEFYKSAHQVMDGAYKEAASRLGIKPQAVSSAMRQADGRTRPTKRMQEIDKAVREVIAERLLLND